VSVCVMPPASITVEGYGFMEYDWLHNTISVAPVDVFKPATGGAAMDRLQMFGSPVITNGQVTLFSETCCRPGSSDFNVTTIPSDAASLSNPASYAPHTIPSLHAAVNGFTDATIGLYPDGIWRLVAMTDDQGDYAIFSASSADGPWSPAATGELPQCANASDPCYGLIGHPELSTTNALFMSYYLRGYGPGVPGHPFAQRPLNHVLLASAALGPGPTPPPAAVPTGDAPSKPTSVRMRSQPSTQPTSSVTVNYKGVSNRGSVILRYTAACTSSDGGASRSVAHAGSNVVPLIVTAVTTGKRYSCTVRATNGWGTSPLSVASPVVIVGAPNAPTSPRATKVRDGQVLVAFTPGANNGAAITNFTATCTSMNHGVTRARTSTARSITVKRLTAGKTYTCAVSATNSRGAGPPSVPSAAVKA